MAWESKFYIDSENRTVEAHHQTVYVAVRDPSLTSDVAFKAMHSWQGFESAGWRAVLRTQAETQGWVYAELYSVEEHIRLLDRVVVQFQVGVSAADKLALAEELVGFMEPHRLARRRLELGPELYPSQANFESLHLVTVPMGVEPIEVVAKFRAHPKVVMAEPDWIRLFPMSTYA